MPNAKVTIAVETFGEYDERASVVVSVDGKRVGGGGMGGEPEDNTRCRDWSWVEPTLEALAKALGADVELTETKSSDW
jgi:hypothetical protein